MSTTRPVEAAAVGSPPQENGGPRAGVAREPLLALLASRDGLRRALVAAEILGAPVALRDQSGV